MTGYYKMFESGYYLHHVRSGKIKFLVVHFNSQNTSILNTNSTHYYTLSRMLQELGFYRMTYGSKSGRSRPITHPRRRFSRMEEQSPTFPSLRSIFPHCNLHRYCNGYYIYYNAFNLPTVFVDFCTDPNKFSVIAKNGTPDIIYNLIDSKSQIYYGA